MPTDSIFTESYTLTDLDHMIGSVYVDVRVSGHTEPITTVVKRCRRQHAIEQHRQVRLSQPAQFRNHGDGLIFDALEAAASRTEVLEEDVTEPDKAWEAQLLRLSLEAIEGKTGVAIDSTVRRLTRTLTTTDLWTYGANAFLFCCSIPPAGTEETSRWLNSLDPAYDHTSNICRPRAFARALAEMVAEQCGPRGQVGSIASSFANAESAPREYPSQYVFHGPVRYEDDPFQVLSSEPSEVRSMLLPLFLKRREYEDQREYRFVVWRESPPPHPVVTLDASKALLGAMTERLPDSTH